MTTTLALLVMAVLLGSLAGAVGTPPFRLGRPTQPASLGHAPGAALRSPLSVGAAVLGLSALGSPGTDGASSGQVTASTQPGDASTANGREAVGVRTGLQPYTARSLPRDTRACRTVARSPSSPGIRDLAS